MKQILPYLMISVVMHVLLAAGALPLSSANESAVQIEVQFQNSAGTATPTRPASSKTLGATPAADGKSDTTILGSDVGIYANYPRLSRILGETGTVLIEINNNRPSIFQSSGIARLDESALAATISALQKGLISGQLSQRSHLKIRFIFKLIR